MKKQYITRGFIAASLLGMSLFANATVSHTPNTFHTIYANNFGSGSSYSTTFLGDINANFTAKVGANAGKFSIKPGQDGYQGIGVSPLGHVSERTPGEIDIGESVNASFSKGIFITSFSLGLLFDGPEYKDVNEVAQVKVGYLDGTYGTFTLTAKGATTAIWSGTGSFVSNLSPAKDSKGGAWQVSNPFGNVRVTSLSFGAVAGMSAATGCGTGHHYTACTNQSDYTLLNITAVPEPETYAMMLIGLFGIGFVARRKQSQL